MLKRLNFKEYWDAIALFLVVVLFSSLIYADPVTQTNQTGDNVTKEYVEVVNIEMIVRALKKGQPVGGLKQTDFLLTENGSPLEITSFTEIRRKIGTNQLEMEAELGDEVQPKKRRFFLFYFWLVEKNVHYRESLLYFFKNVYREGDLVLLAVKNKAIKISSPGEIQPALVQLEKEIHLASMSWTSWIRSTSRKLQTLIDEYFRELNMRQPNLGRLDALRFQLVSSLELSWKEYQFTYLISNSIKLQALADALKKIGLEKWGIVYFQQTPFPMLEIDRLEQMISAKIEDEGVKWRKAMMPYRLKLQMPVKSGKFIQDIQGAFISADATFHLLIPYSDMKLDEETPDLAMQDVYSDWRETFRQVTMGTGGEIVTGNKLRTSIQRVVEREDIYYQLTYRPQDLKNTNRNVRIAAKQMGLKIYHVSRINVETPKNIEITDVSFKNDTLSLTIKNYHRVGIGDRMFGDVMLFISAEDQDGNINELTNPMELEGEDASITMKLSVPKDGVLKVTVKAVDNLSGLESEHTFNTDKET